MGDLLLLDDGLSWTNFNTRTALGTLLLVDYVNIFPFFNRICLTFIGTGPACHAVFGYYKCQEITSF